MSARGFVVTQGIRQKKKGDLLEMIERIKNNVDPKTKKADHELSDAELARVAGGIIRLSDVIVS